MFLIKLNSIKIWLLTGLAVTAALTLVVTIARADSISTTIPAGAAPLAVAVNPVTNRIYVANNGSANVTVIDGSNNLTQTVAVGTSPWDVAVNPATNKIYVPNGGSNTVTVIDGSNNLTQTVAVGTNPHTVAVNSVTNKIYVANNDNVTVIDGSNNLTQTVNVGGSAGAVAVNPVTNKIYVVSNNNVAVIDGSNNLTQTVAVGTGPSAVAVNPVTNKIYVANYDSNNVTVIDGSNNLTQTVAAGTSPWAVAVNPDTNKIYVVNRGSANVTVIDGSDNSTQTVAAGTEPKAVAVNPDTNKIYVANHLTANVTVIDGSNNSTQTVAVGTLPQAVAVNPITNKIYVPNLATANVTVINGIDVRFIDLTISLYKTADTSAERAPYEGIIPFTADAIYEMSNGAHKIRNITIYQNGEFADTADVHWNTSEWPRAVASGYGHEYAHIYMGDIFSFKDEDGNPTPYDPLLEASWCGAGYTLGHEMGHYYYGLYDEYELRKDEDIPVENSVMNSQWRACWSPPDFNWLNFSIPKNNTKRTEQHRIYEASGWETLARPVSLDPRNGYRSSRITRTYYPELAVVAPLQDQDSPLELPAGQANARTDLNITWMPVGSAPIIVLASIYQANVESILGDVIEYPLPVLLLASVSGDDPVAKAGISASVTRPDNTVTGLILKDDGVPPDVIANDGFYSGIMPYNQGGDYVVDVTFDNNAGTGEFTQIGFHHTIGPNGEIPDLTPQPVGENFLEVATTTVTINNFQADDHGDIPANATILLPNNVDLAGRIDWAGDVDVFKITGTATEELILRVSNFALGMELNIRLLEADGTTVIGEYDFTPQGNKYFFTPVNVQAGQPFYAEISHLDPGAITGYYDISVGQALTSGGESGSNDVFLPIIIK